MEDTIRRRDQCIYPWTACAVAHAGSSGTEHDPGLLFNISGLPDTGSHDWTNGSFILVGVAAGKIIGNLGHHI
jgi:hypothetical protein